MNLSKELELVARHSRPDQVDQVCARLDPSWIEEALLATGTASIRTRRLPAPLIVWLVIGMALLRNRPIEDVVDQLELKRPSKYRRPAAKSSISEARARLGDEPLSWLFSKSANVWAHRSAAEHDWRGLSLYGGDGTTLRVPDSKENREYFGGPTSGRGESGYPMLRLVGLMALRSHLLAAAAFGPYEVGECTLASELWRHLPDDSLTALDKGFFGANILIPLAQSGKNRHWLIPAKKKLTWRVVKKLGRNDDLVEMEVSPEARKKQPNLPTHWTFRAIRYQLKGFLPRTLLTSLTDPVMYPAAEIVALYHERWELELGFDDVKTEMLEREETIRSQKPTGVSQELFGILLVHNLVRLEMEHVAAQAGVEPLRISFVWALRLIRDEWIWASISRSPGAIPGHLDDLALQLTRFLLPARRQRTSLRGVKIKMSAYNRIRPGDRAAAKKGG